MTAPLIDTMAEFPLYSVAANNIFELPAAYRQIGEGSNSIRIYLDRGVYSLMLTYDGPREVEMLIIRDTTATPPTPPASRLKLPTGVANSSRQVSTMISNHKKSCVYFRTNTVLTEAELAAGYSLGVVITRMGMPAL